MDVKQLSDQLEACRLEVSDVLSQLARLCDQLAGELDRLDTALFQAESRGAVAVTGSDTEDATT